MVNNVVFIKIFYKGYFYSAVIIESDGIKVNRSKSTIKIDKSFSQKFFVDGIFVHYFLQELAFGPFYRNKFLAFHNPNLEKSRAIKLALVPVSHDRIDHNWNHRITYLVREKCEVEHILSWLSTLGGAFSALGDYFLECAETAGKISVNQLKLAFRLGDPYIMSRCRLYFSLSLIQRQYFKVAKHIIQSEFKQAKNNTVIDNKLINMCKGIWCKYKYEYQNFRNDTRQKTNKKLLLH